MYIYILYIYIYTCIEKYVCIQAVQVGIDTHMRIQRINCAEQEGKTHPEIGGIIKFRGDSRKTSLKLTGFPPWNRANSPFLFQGSGDLPVPPTQFSGEKPMLLVKPRRVSPWISVENDLFFYSLRFWAIYYKSFAWFKATTLGGDSLTKTTMSGWPRRVGRYKLPRRLDRRPSDRAFFTFVYGPRFENFCQVSLQHLHIMGPNMGPPHLGVVSGPKT